MLKNIYELVDKAKMIQVHLTSDHPEIQIKVEEVLEDILAYRSSLGLKTYKLERYRKDLKRIILDLWVAATFTDNPWRSVSFRNGDYTKEERWRKVYFKKDITINIYKALIAKEYIELASGDNHVTKRYSRIMATNKLLDKCKLFKIEKVKLDLTVAPESVRLHVNRKEVDYVDTEQTNAIRLEVDKINKVLSETDISVEGKDYDTTDKLIRRIFNDTFDRGGRFFGGFWEGMPKENRRLLRIGSKETSELDFKATFPSIMYGMRGLPIPGDCYAIEGYDRNRQVKTAVLFMVTCTKETLLNDYKYLPEFIEAIEQYHSPIADMFYNPELCFTLMKLESDLAAKIMSELAQQGIPVIGVHDSFVVAKEHEDLLHETMTKWFQHMFNGVVPMIDKKN